jgi:hypothetical protein
MTGPELRTIRLGLGLSLSKWGGALGYSGERQALATAMRRFEAGEREIPEWIARLAFMYQKHGIPKQWR